MTIPAELTVMSDLPAAPLVLANTAFLTTLATVEEQARDLRITDAASQQLAASLQVRLTQAGTVLEKQRAALKAPFIEIGRKIDDAARAPAFRIEAAKSLIKTALTAYDTAERAKAAEAERVRQAELRRLEDIRQAEIVAEAARKRELEKIAADAAAKAAADAKAAALAGVVPPMDFDDEEPAPPPEPPQKTETQVALETLKHTPAVAAVRPAGITFRETLVPTIVDLALVPEPFIERTPKMRAIIATFCSGWKPGAPMPECAGVKFEVKKDAVSSGRGAF